MELSILMYSILYLLMGAIYIALLISTKTIEIPCNYETCYNKKIAIILMTIFFPIVLIWQWIWLIRVLCQLIHFLFTDYEGLFIYSKSPSFTLICENLNYYKEENGEKIKFQNFYGTSSEAKKFAEKDYKKTIKWIKTSANEYISSETTDVRYYIRLI
jgi:hypothetical protein